MGNQGQFYHNLNNPALNGNGNVSVHGVNPTLGLIAPQTVGNPPSAIPILTAQATNGAVLNVNGNASNLLGAQAPQPSSTPGAGANNVILYSINTNDLQRTPLDVVDQHNLHNGNAGGGILNSTQASNQMKRLTLEWTGAYPLGSPFGASTSVNGLALGPAVLPLPLSGAVAEQFLQDEYPEIDMNTPMPDHWCTIHYFENDLQVGDIFKVYSHLSHLYLQIYHLYNLKLCQSLLSSSIATFFDCFLL